MDMNKILQWMDLASKSQTTDFWKGIFDQTSFEEFLKSNTDTDRSNQQPSSDPRKESNFPPTDIYVTNEEIYLVSSLAGYLKEDIQLSVSGTKLLIKGSNNPVISGNAVQQERYQGDFQRVIQLPEPTYPNQIRATFNNGLLFISYKRQFAKEEHVPIE